eukprot:TRINITY_DN40459_c0_g1_i1.p1 TRINITY_DN40459_c0_g1~~TRINITY_DN40459_c0_g1_i1.p1  ORF type:complete len:484 (-),score=43.65 TRINITY_DN40459_c0_g1_i1:83-1534(-)
MEDLAAERRSGPAMSAWLFLALAVALNVAIGSLTSFSYWKIGFDKYFTPCDSTDRSLVVSCWDESATTQLYSAGVMGGFICILPGFIFDHAGPLATGVYGLLCVNIGFGGMILLMESASPAASPNLVAFLYFLEEQGSAAALYMLAVCILVRAFPSEYVGIITGCVSVAFGLSGLFWHNVAINLFGFDSKDANDTDLIGLLGTMLFAIDAIGLAVVLLAWRMPKPQQPLVAKSTTGVQDSRGRLTGRDTTLSQTVFSLEFAFLLTLFSIASSQIISVSGYVSSIESAFHSLDPEIFDSIPFIGNVAGRVFYATLVSILVSKFGLVGVTFGSVWINVCLVLCFTVLTWAAMTGTDNETSAMLLYVAFTLGYSAYGGGVCFASSFTKLTFKEEYVGMCVGFLFTIAAFANAFFSTYFGPEDSSIRTREINHHASDFVRPWTCGLVTSVVVMPVSLLIAARSYKDCTCVGTCELSSSEEDSWTESE